jgi:hypothetical protein
MSGNQPSSSRQPCRFHGTPVCFVCNPPPPPMFRPTAAQLAAAPTITLPPSGRPAAAEPLPARGSASGNPVFGTPYTVPYAVDYGPLPVPSQEAVYLTSLGSCVRHGQTSCVRCNPFAFNRDMRVPDGSK